MVDTGARAPAIGLVLAAGMSVQFGAAFAATLFDELGPGGTAFLRLGLAAAILVAVWRPRIRGHERADLRLVLGFGISLGAMNWAFYEALDRIPLGAAVTFEMVGPLSVAVLGSRRPVDALWAVLALAGVVLLGNPFGGGTLDPVGIGLALVAGSCWAAYILLSARTGQRFPGGGGLALAMVVGTLFTLPAGIVEGGADLLVPGLLLSALGVALACSVIPYSLELEALRRLPAALFGVLMSLEPAIASLAGFLILDQALDGRELVAIALVVAACAGAALNSRGPVAVEV